MNEIIRRDYPNKNVLYLENISENQIIGKIVVAEKGPIQDILVFNKSGYFQWSSLYLRTILRNNYYSVKEAIESRLNKKMRVYILNDRGEFRNFIKYNNERI
jgi:hypothetical protein